MHAAHVGIIHSDSLSPQGFTHKSTVTQVCFGGAGGDLLTTLVGIASVCVWGGGGEGSGGPLDLGQGPYPDISRDCKCVGVGGGLLQYLTILGSTGRSAAPHPYVSKKRALSISKHDSIQLCGHFPTH